MQHYHKFVLTVLALTSAALAQESDISDAEKTKARQTVHSYEVKVRLNYLLYLPPDYEAKPESADKKWPLLVFLHGAGERGDEIGIVKRFGPPRRVETDKNFPFVLISPQCPKGSFWNTDHLLQLIKTTIEERNIDSERVYLTGLSMGGFGSWALAAKAPELFAAVAPVCGGGDPKTAEKIKDLPIWAFHGDVDRVVPISASQRMVNAIKDVGGKDIEFTIYEGVGHDSWTKAYGDEKLYTWFLKHRRESRREH